MSREKITAATCLSCGVCCVAPYGQDAFADVTAVDERRLGRRFVRLHVVQTTPFEQLLGIVEGNTIPQGAIRTKECEQKTGPLKGLLGSVCAALRGSLMSRVSCSIYEKRPQVCREAVVPGDRVCRQIRAAFQAGANE